MLALLQWLRVHQVQLCFGRVGELEDNHHKLENKHHDLEVKLNDKFIEKLDEMRKEIKQDIQKYADKLEGKQDKKRS